MGLVLARRPRNITNFTVDHERTEIRRAEIVAVDLQEVSDAYVIIASKGGAPTHPAWYLNLQADAECEIKVGALDLAVTARGAVGDERQSLWGELAEVYAPYNAYQETAGDRVIPVVVLEPR